MISTKSESRPRRLLEAVRDSLRVKHYSYRTEESYVYWIKRFMVFHDKRHPRDMGREEIESFLTFLAVEENVAALTQNQAFSALLFLYKEVLRQELAESIKVFPGSIPPLQPTPREAAARLHPKSLSQGWARDFNLSPLLLIFGSRPKGARSRGWGM